MTELADHGHDKPVFGCDDCIKVGNRGTPEHPAEGWTFYRVDVTKEMTAYYYVLAPSKEAAQADANEIVLDRMDFETMGPDSYVSPAMESPPSGEPLWTGGPDGDWTVTPAKGAA